MSCWQRFYFRLVRRKHVSEKDLESTTLARCLSVIDLTALGVGSTLGAGAYVISGQVAKSDAGPAVIISFLIAAIASMLAGLCYAEFGSRVPKAGSAYIYTYVTVGEFIAFIIGWNLVLEYVIGSASVARTSSGYVDNLIGTGTLIDWFQETMPMDIPTFAPYFDLFAFGITMLLAVLLAIGVKESATFTKVFTGLNLIILSYIVIIGAFKDDPANWSIPADQVPNTKGSCGNSGLEPCGKGGFSPYGFSGIMSGAATCFFAFVGFDAIATTGEEAKNPQKAIPVATVLSLGIVFVFYTAISVTITMMAPYFDLDSNAPFSVIFQNVGWTVSMYIVGVGAVCALSTSLLGAMFPLPRVVFAMARDGIVFRFLAIISKRFKTPVIATLLSGLLAATMAALFDVESLVDMMSIGTLLAYTLVSACVLLLRYEADRTEESGGFARYRIKIVDQDSRNVIVKLFRPNSTSPTRFSANAVKALTSTLALWLIGLGIMLTFATLTDGWAIAVLTVLVVLSLFTVFLIWIQPQNSKKLLFMVPAVPFFPCLSMFFNIFLIINLNELTFLRFIIWMAIGFIIYFGYGIWHSAEEIQLRASPANGTVVILPEFGVHGSGVNLQTADSEVSVNEKVLNGIYFCKLQ